MLKIVTDVICHYPRVRFLSVGIDYAVEILWKRRMAGLIGYKDKLKHERFNMDSEQQRRGWYDYLRSIDSLLSTNVPLPSFLTKPIQIPGLNNSKPFKRPTARGTTTQSKSKSGQFVLEGPIENGKTSRLAIQGKDFEVDSNTWIIGTIEIGAIAKVKGSMQFDKRVALQIVILKGAER